MPYLSSIVFTIPNTTRSSGGRGAGTKRAVSTPNGVTATGLSVYLPVSARITSLVEQTASARPSANWTMCRCTAPAAGKS